MFFETQCIYFFRNLPTGQTLGGFLRATAQTTQSRTRMCLLRVKKIEIDI